MANLQWVTPAGLLNQIEKSVPYSFTLSTNAGNTFVNYSIISGALPAGLVLITAGSPAQIPIGTIMGTPLNITEEMTYQFTVRATNANGLADRTFSLKVVGAQQAAPLPALFPNGNLGIFPDGTYTNINIVAYNPNTLDSSGITYNIIEGQLPDGLTLNNGYITGFVNPSVLLFGNNGFDLNPFDIYPWDFTPSNVSIVFDFDLQLTAANIPVVTSYNFTIERSDVFADPSANISLPYYHTPIVTNANYSIDANGNITASINLGNVNSDNNFYFQYKGFDYEGDPIGYEVMPDNITPSNISLNVNTGWLTGYVNENQANTYIFDVRVYKVNFEPAFNPNVSVNPYQIIIPSTLTVLNPVNQNVVWNYPQDLGSIIVGAPSKLSLTANITEPFVVTTGDAAEATATMRLVQANIVTSGLGYLVGDLLTVPGGNFGNAAQVQVNAVNNFGEILGITVVDTIQNYSALPILTNTSLNGGNGNSAIFDLFFGVDTVTVTNNGQYYPGALIGFSNGEEQVQATASARIKNGSITSIVVSDPGSGYQFIPKVLITSHTTITNANPIKYSLIGGSLPLGLALTSNGMIIGRPSYQAIDISLIYIFTVRAQIGLNFPVIVGDSLQEEFNEILTADQTFFLTLDPTTGSIPTNNLYLDFLLSPKSTDQLLGPINNAGLIPNDAIYRNDDFYFGIAQNVRMLVGYGMAPVENAQMVAALAKYHHNKTYLVSGLNWAQSLDSSGNVEYEVIYATIRDEFTNIYNQTYTGSVFKNTTALPFTADDNLYTIDSNVYDASDNNFQIYYPGTFPNMVNQLNKTVSDFAVQLLPSWMTSIQPNGAPLGFVQGIPLVYVKPGTGQRLLYNLQNYYNLPGNNLNLVNAKVDRYIWDTGLTKNWNTTTQQWDYDPQTPFDNGMGDPLLTENFTVITTENGNILTTEYVTYYMSGTPISTQQFEVLITESGDILTTEMTTFADSTIFDFNTTKFFDASDGYLKPDENSIYLKFKYDNFIDLGIIGV